MNGASSFSPVSYGFGGSQSVFSQQSGQSSKSNGQILALESSESIIQSSSSSSVPNGLVDVSRVTTLTSTLPELSEIESFGIFSSMEPIGLDQTNSGSLASAEYLKFSMFDLGDDSTGDGDSDELCFDSFSSQISEAADSNANQEAVSKGPVKIEPNTGLYDTSTDSSPSFRDAVKKKEFFHPAPIGCW